MSYERMNYGHRLLDDPFFIPGNIACNVKNQNTNEILINKKKSRIKIECEEDGCDTLFDTIEDYEVHYNSYHRLRCKTCNRLFLSSYLLDLHMNENHGNYFSCESKYKSAYKCFVEGCAVLSSDSKSRLDHCIESHNYPENINMILNIN